MEKQNKNLRIIGAGLTLFAIAMFIAIFLGAFDFKGNQRDHTIAFTFLPLIFGLMLYFFNKPVKVKDYSEMSKVKIGDLDHGSVYYRNDGSAYKKANNNYQYKVKLNNNTEPGSLKWLPDGESERLNYSEMVTLV